LSPRLLANLLNLFFLRISFSDFSSLLSYGQSATKCFGLSQLWHFILPKVLPLKLLLPLLPNVPMVPTYFLTKRATSSSKLFAGHEGTSSSSQYSSTSSTFTILEGEPPSW